MPSVSVVIPCRNEAEFIGELLDAVRAQDLPPVETIVVDNGSIDGSVPIVEAYAARHPEMPIRVLHVNRGQLRLEVSGEVALSLENQ